MNSLDRQHYVKRYTTRYAEFGYDPRTLGWGKSGRQHIRFAALMGLAKIPAGSVLDVGCGFGDLYGYLQRIGWEGRYVGVDIVPTLLDEAKKQYSGIDVRLCDISSQEIDEQFDYVVSSGIFNAQLQGESQEEYIAAMVERMLRLSRIGMAADFLTSFVDYRQADAYHADPSAILELGIHIARRVVIRHDYLPYEFCVYLYKQSEITEDSRYAAELTLSRAQNQANER
jgi:SAM-dependent methyltransferase